jgi:hypothetical protein
MIGIVASQFDTDALSFLNRAGITNPTEILAINYLVRTLKLNNLWSKFHAIYPFVGGTNSSTSRNLINSSYTITWVGGAGMTFSSTGIQSNGTTGYGNTGFNPSIISSFLISSASFGVYSRTANAINGVEMGSSIGDNYCQLVVNGTVPNINARLNQSSASATTDGTIPNTQGLMVVSRTSGTNIQDYRNGNLLSTKSITTTNKPNGNVFICCRNLNGSPAVFSNRQFAFAFIGLGLIAAEVSTLYTIVQQYQTILGRQV